MKKIIGTLCFGVFLLALGMGAPSHAYTDKCRSCWSACFNPLLNGGINVPGDRDCSHCNPLCSGTQVSCTDKCPLSTCGSGTCR